MSVIWSYHSFENIWKVKSDKPFRKSQDYGLTIDINEIFNSIFVDWLKGAKTDVRTSVKYDTKLDNQKIELASESSRRYKSQNQKKT